MPITFHVLPARNLIVSRYWGEIGDAEFIESYRRLCARPDVRPGSRELVDLRDVTDMPITASAMREVAEIVETFLGDEGQTMQTAVIASTELEYGLSRMYQAFASASPEQVEVFRSPEEALAWLGLGEVAFDDLLAGETERQS